jgi:hypothetical protein
MWWKSKTAKPGIYRITNITTGREYIGATNQTIKKRWEQHIRQLNQGTHGNKLLQKDWTELGSTVFSFEVIETVHGGWIKLAPREIYWQDRGYTREGRYNPPNRTSSAFPQTADEWCYMIELCNTLALDIDKLTVNGIFAADALARLLSQGLIRTDREPEAVQAIWNTYDGDATYQEWSILVDALLDRYEYHHYC